MATEGKPGKVGQVALLTDDLWRLLYGAVRFCLSAAAPRAAYRSAYPNQVRMIVECYAGHLSEAQTRWLVRTLRDNADRSPDPVPWKTLARRLEEGECVGR